MFRFLLRAIFVDKDPHYVVSCHFFLSEDLSNCHSVSRRMAACDSMSGQELSAGVCRLGSSIPQPSIGNGYTLTHGLLYLLPGQ